MCLILLSWKQHKDFQLILAANRDEFYNRSTSKATFWKDKPQILAGRDLVAGGTWIGVNKTGRIAALTNYRDPKNIDNNAVSRGSLTVEFLEGMESPLEYLTKLKESPTSYNGFNLIAGDHSSLFHYNNVDHNIQEILPGTYGLSNGFFEENWPKVKSGRDVLKGKVQNNTINPEQLLTILSDKEVATDNQLPQTGIPLEWERALSPLFIETDGYGTRCSTIIYQDYEGKFNFIEKTYPVADQIESMETFAFQTSGGK